MQRGEVQKRGRQNSTQVENAAVWSPCSKVTGVDGRASAGRQGILVAASRPALPVNQLRPRPVSAASNCSLFFCRFLNASRIAFRRPNLVEFPSKDLSIHTTMPPTKRRKPASEEPETDEDAPPPPQQPRANSKAKQQQKEPLRPLDPDMPTNTVLPTPLTVPARHPDASIKLAAWNIAGLKACDKKGLKFYLDAEDPDVLLLSETKVQTDPHIAHLDARFPHAAWGGDPQKGYAGVAVLSKIKPLSVSSLFCTYRLGFLSAFGVLTHVAAAFLCPASDVNYGLPTLPQPESSHGRMITLEFDTCYLIVVCKFPFFLAPVALFLLANPWPTASALVFNGPPGSDVPNAGQGLKVDCLPP